MTNYQNYVTSQHNDLTSGHSYLVSGGRNTPPYIHCNPRQAESVSLLLHLQGEYKGLG